MFHKTRWRQCAYAASWCVTVTACSSAEGVGETEAVGSVRQPDTVSTTGSMNYARQNHIAVPLAGGVLVAGGHPGNLVSTATAEVYNPISKSWTVVASMGTARRDFAGCRLPNGKVLVAGGHNDQGQGVLSSAELYNPATNQWSPTGSLLASREDLQINCLQDGRALATGGFSGPSILSSAEVYNPATGTWSSAGNMPYPSHGHRNAVLRDGRVLVVGGSNVFGPALNSAALWSPSTNTWSSTGSMATPRGWQGVSPLYDGRVLAAGGFNGFAATNTAEIYDPSTGRWSPAASLHVARQSASTVGTSFGPLVIGGFNGAGVASTELYNVRSNSWSQQALNSPMWDGTATPLFDSNAVAAGGTTNGSGATAITQSYKGRVTCIK